MTVTRYLLCKLLTGFPAVKHSVLKKSRIAAS